MRICIIGGGVVGLNIALELSSGRASSAATGSGKAMPRARSRGCFAKDEIYIFEKEKFLGHHTSTRNSEVIHAGFAYPPESLKAKLCVEGNGLTYKLLNKLRVPYKKCGKWVIACGRAEEEALFAAVENAKTCGVRGFRHAAISEFQKAEPSSCNVTGAAFSEDSGIMDAAAYMRALEVALSSRKNVTIVYPCRITAIDGVASALETERGPIHYDLLINSAGLWADEIHGMVCRNQDFQMCALYEIIPFKGEYYSWRRGGVQTMIYPVPERFLAQPPSPHPSPLEEEGVRRTGEGASDPALISSMGIHTHRSVAGELFIGPSQIKLTPDRKSDYTIITPPEVFATSLSKFIRGVEAKDLEPAYAGNRPKLYKEGLPVGDFDIFREKNVIHLMGMESPALTAAPAIARYVGKMI